MCYVQKRGQNMFFDVGNGLFINTDAVCSMLLVSDFDQEGNEVWYIKLFGTFSLPERYVAPDGGVVVGPFKSRQEAEKYIGLMDEEIVFEAEHVEAH